MGYTIYINDPETGETLHCENPHGLIGSTYCVGDTELRLSITCNYSKFYYRKETLGESTEVCGEKPVDGALPVLVEESGGIPGLALLTVPQARERVTRAINNLRDKQVDADGNPYDENEPIEPVYTEEQIAAYCKANPGKEWLADIFRSQNEKPRGYWAPTEANARRALINLLSLLLLAPDNGKIEVC